MKPYYKKPDEREKHMERLLRRARQQVFDKPSREKAIKWLKRELAPYWRLRHDEIENKRMQNYMM